MKKYTNTVVLLIVIFFSLILVQFSYAQVKRIQVWEMPNEFIHHLFLEKKYSL